MWRRGLGPPVPTLRVPGRRRQPGQPGSESLPPGAQQDTEDISSALLQNSLAVENPAAPRPWHRRRKWLIEITLLLHTLDAKTPADTNGQLLFQKHHATW